LAIQTAKYRDLSSGRRPWRDRGNQVVTTLHRNQLAAEVDWPDLDPPGIASS